MTQHLSALSAGVRQLAGGDFTARVPVRSSDEFGALAGAFNQMAADLERHQALVVEQERLRARAGAVAADPDRDAAAHAAASSAPAEIAGVSMPAREVGGDFFNYFVLPDGRLALLVGDVSGKGVSAALLMANVQATLRARLPLETDLARARRPASTASWIGTRPAASTSRCSSGSSTTDGRHAPLRQRRPQPAVPDPRGAAASSRSSSTGLPIALYAGHGYREVARRARARRSALLLHRRPRRNGERTPATCSAPSGSQALLAAEQSHGIDAVLAARRSSRSAPSAARPNRSTTRR